MSLTGEHQVGDTDHVAIHNAIDEALETKADIASVTTAMAKLPYFAANYVSIQAAVDAAAANATAKTPRSVYVAAGTWQEIVKLKSFVTVYGDGEATVIKAPSSTNATAVVSLYDGNQERCYIRDLAIDGNAVGQSGTVHGLSIVNTNNGAGFTSGRKTPGHTVSNLYIHHTSGNGIHWAGDAWAGDNICGNVVTYYTDGHGIYSTVPDTDWFNLDLGQAGVHGFNMACSNNRFTNIKSWYSGRIDTTGTAFYIDGRRNQFAAVEAQDSKGHGFQFTANAYGNILAAATADSCGSSSGTTGSGFYFDNLATNNKLQGTTFDRAPSDRVGGLVAQAIGLTMVSGALRNSIDINVGTVSTSQFSGTYGDNDIKLASGTGTAGTWMARSTLTPTTNATLDIGSSTNRWNFVWAANLNAYAHFANTSAGNIRKFNYQTAGAERWSLQADATAESGSNAGTDFAIIAYADNSTELSRPLTIKRSSGVATMPLLKVGAYATGSRPAAATIGAGGVVFDTTLGKPIFSDGTNWAPARGNIQSKSSAYTALSSDGVILATAGASGWALTLPTVAGQLTVKKVDSAAGTITVSGSGTIDGASSWPIVNQNDSFTFVSADGTNWYII